MSEAILRNEHLIIKETATAVQNPGDLAEKGGLAAIALGAGPMAIGDLVTWDATPQLIEVTCASGTTFAEGATVQWNDTTKLAVASGNFTLGKAAYPKIAGQTVVTVFFNK